MRIDLKWLKEYIDIKIDTKELAHCLTMSGVEVEGVETKGGDTVLDVSITPNRGDCLSMVGMAREISAVTGVPWNYPDMSLQEDLQESNPIQVEVENEADCPRYAARYVSGVKVGPSPDWIKRCLEISGIRAVNNVVDITNYVLLELGHPLHPFDADTIAGKKIIVSSAEGERTFVTLDGVERKLTSDTLLICDSEKPVALAGIMGGLATEVKENTRNILLESAYFTPATIRKTSRRLGLATEASYRFERGCDPDNVLRALDRAAGMIAQIAGGKIHGSAIDCYPNPISLRKVVLRFARLQQILGFAISPDAIVDICEKLGFVFDPEEVSDQQAHLLIPTFRSDVTREIDLIEEVARIYGYQRIPSTVPSGIGNRVPMDTSFALQGRTRKFMAGLGFFEGINFTFTSESNFSKLKLRVPVDTASSEGRALRLENPLNAQQNILRTSLIPSLLENLADNLRWNQTDVRLFEISACYEQEEDSFKERKLLAGVMTGRRNVNYWKDEKEDLDFYDVKGVVEAVFGEFGIDHHRFAEVESPFLHPKKGLQVLCGKQQLGVFGELNPEYKLFDNSGVYIFELDFSAILTHRKEAKRFNALTKYPGVVRDLAVVAPVNMHASQVFEAMQTFQDEFLARVDLVSIYTGSPIDEGYKSMAFSLFYQSSIKTLVDEEVDQLHSRIAKHLQQKLGIKLR